MNEKDKVKFTKLDHISVIKEIAKGMKKAKKLFRYLEVGIAKGACFNEIAPLVRKSAYAVDIDLDAYKYIEHNKNLVWTMGASDLFFNLIGDTVKFNLIFIDADHSHEASLKDFLNACKVLEEDGILLMHDSYPPNKKYVNKDFCGTVYKTAEYIRDNMRDEYEVVTLPFYFGISIVRRAKQQLAWVN